MGLDKFYKHQKQQQESDFAEGKAIWQNTVKPYPNEFVEIELMDKLEEGTAVRCHNVKGVSLSGKPFWNYVYCVKEDDKEAECEYCDSDDKDVRRLNWRFFFWVWAYGHYHDPSRDYDRDEFEDVTVGRKAYRKENVNKPQILQISRTVFDDLVGKDERTKNGIQEKILEYTCRRADRTTYSFESSELDPEEEVVSRFPDWLLKLPSLESIAKGELTEVDIDNLD